MTHTEETPDSMVHPVMTAGGPEAGDTLVGRYRLEEHVNDDASGRRVWRGIDVVLRRPIAVVLRYPGGESASEMISAAIAASRITHPHLVDVYDAIDEESRAYVVREWVDGMSLRELVADGPLDSVRATSIAHAVASAVSALHATGMAHGNVHPGSILIADDGRVVLTDSRASDTASQERDVRAIGAILYAALTGHWPHAEAGPDGLPDATRDATGTLASPRQVRGGVPSVLSDLATDLLNPPVEPPSSEALAQELARLDSGDGDDLFGEAGALGFTSINAGAPPEVRPRNGRKFAISIAALLVVAAGGLIIASKLGGSSPTHAANIPRTNPSVNASNPAGQPKAVTIAAVRVVDPKGDGQELAGADKMIDGNENTDWHTDWYKAPDFGGGNYKPGMGVLIDLGSTVNVANVKIDFDEPGATVSARIGGTDPGEGRPGDAQIVSSYTQVGSTITDAQSSTVLPIGQATRYIMVWITKLPPLSGSTGKYEVGIDEISVES